MRGVVYFLVVSIERKLKGAYVRFDLLKALVVVMSLGLVPLSSLVSSAFAEEPKTCADGKPCPTDAELEDSCSDEVESL